MTGRLADPQLPDLPAGLTGWHWERRDHLLRLVNEATAWATPWRDEDDTKANIAIAERYVRVMDYSHEEPMTAATKKRKPSASTIPSLADPTDDIQPMINQFRANGYQVEIAGPARWLLFAPGQPGKMCDADGLRIEALALPATPATSWHPDQVFQRPPDYPDRDHVAPQTLLDGRWQPRTSMNAEKLAELVESVKTHGVLEDLIAVVNEDGQLELVTGHRRKAAAIAAGVSLVPVKIVEVSASQARTLAIISNDDRDDLSDIERGQAYEEIIKQEDISESELARRLSRPRAYIQQRRMLARAAPEVQQALAAGTLTFSQTRSVCLGAADSYEAQRAALKQITDQLRSGRKVTDAEAQRLAEDAVRKQVKKDMLGLGWQVAEEYISGSKRAFVWGGDQRPREWTAAELLTAVREQRQSTGTLPTDRTLTSEEEQWITMRGAYFYQTTCAPWFLTASDGKVQVVAPDELDTLIADAQAALAIMQERYTVAGWTLERKRGSSWEATSRQERSEQLWGWHAVEELIIKIEAGQIPQTPEPKHGAAQAWRCARCKKEQRSHKSEWRNTGRVCLPCAKALDAEHEAQLVATASTLSAAWSTWLEKMPHDLLCSMVLGVFSAQHRAILGIPLSVPIDELTKHILKMEHAVLATAYPRLVAMQAERWHVTFQLPSEQKEKEAA